MLAMGRRTSLGCLHAFHEDGMAGYKIRHNMMMRGLPRQDHRDHEGEKVMKKWGRGEGQNMLSQCSGSSILMVYLICLACLIFSPPIYQPTTKLVCELIKQV